MKIKDIKLQLFPSGEYKIIAGNIKELNSYILKNLPKVETLIECEHAITTSGGGNFTILVRTDKKNPTASLVHEIFHAVRVVKEYYGIEEKVGTNEFAAYLGGYLFEEGKTLLK